MERAHLLKLFSDQVVPPEAVSFQCMGCGRTVDIRLAAREATEWAESPFRCTREEKAASGAKFEYKLEVPSVPCEEISPGSVQRFEALLNATGALGWELVSYHCTSSSVPLGQPLFLHLIWQRRVPS